MADRPLRVLDSPNFLILSFLFHVFPKIISVLKSPTYDFEIGRDPTDMMVVLDIPKGPSSYNCLTKLDQLLHRYTHVDDYIYWAPRPNEELSMSDCCEITMYKDCFDGGLMLSLHPFFFFYLNLQWIPCYPSHINLNAWKKALYFLFHCLRKKLCPLSSYLGMYSSCTIYLIITHSSTSLPRFIFIFQSI